MNTPTSALMELPVLKPREFAKIRELAYGRFGLDLRAGKERLVSSRLARHIRAGGFRSFDEYYRHVLADASGEAVIAMIDALTTNHTGFLREEQHFEHLRRIIVPECLKRRRIAIWCAACSSGEEPYSALFSVLVELERLGRRPDTDLKIEMLASDISTRVLGAAVRGVYPADRLRTLPPDWLPRFFLRGEGGSRGFYRVKPEVAARIRFERLNLMEPFPAGPEWDLIFCRNVMIYFDKPTQAQLVNRLAGRLAANGHLYVGHSESLAGIEHPLQYIKPAVYRRPAEGIGPVKQRSDGTLFRNKR